jgi:hypothetical protein
VIKTDGDPGHIITSNGTVKVIGSNISDFDKLPVEKRIEL